MEHNIILDEFRNRLMKDRDKATSNYEMNMENVETYKRYADAELKTIELIDDALEQLPNYESDTFSDLIDDSNEA